MSEKIKSELIDDRVHLMGSIGTCCIRAACGAVMQPTSSEWTNEVNYWGKTGIRKERPFTTLTLDPSKVTCKREGCKTNGNPAQRGQ